MKRILVFGAGKSATVLIRTLLEICAGRGWHLTVADQDRATALSKIGDSASGSALEINVNDESSRRQAIAPVDLVISLLPPIFHHLVALDCLALGKNLLTASYANKDMMDMDDEVRSKDLIFLCEMGLDPGIDHMSAMQMIDQLRMEGAVITGFQSHCGGLVAPESDDTPWHYKISWNPANVVSAGKDGALFLEDGRTVQLNYQEIFQQDRRIEFHGLGEWAVYPNRDSLKYREIYGLGETMTFIRTTIRHPDFIRGWKALVQSGLTFDTSTTVTSSYSDWAEPLLPFVDDGNRGLFDYLGLFDSSAIANPLFTLQEILERKLAMKPGDKDMILMLHQIDFELEGKRYREESSFRLDGFDSIYTAMATTVGLPLAHAAELILDEEIDLKGVQIPVSAKIYDRILPRLAEDGIVFETTRREV